MNEARNGKSFSSILPSSTYVLFSSTRPLSSSTLFPYTTLFRSGGCGVTQSGMLETRFDLVKRLYNLETERSEEHTSELQSRLHLVCRLLLEKKKIALDRMPHDSQSAKYTVALNADPVRYSRSRD